MALKKSKQWVTSGLSLEGLKPFPEKWTGAMVEQAGDIPQVQACEHVESSSEWDRLPTTAAPLQTATC